MTTTIRLAGADVATLLDDAAAAADALSADVADNPAVRLASALGAAHADGAEKVVLADTDPALRGFADWAEQLIAESTGKAGTGLLPVVVEGQDAPGFTDAGADATPVAIGPLGGGAGIATSGPLGGLFLLWEYATALVGRVLGINPFDQPDVEAAKKAARSLLDAPRSAQDGAPLCVDGPVEVYASGGWLTAGDVASAGDAVRALVAAVPRRGYLAVQAYLDRIDDASTAVIRSELARRTGVQTTFGWGPRFLHSTGQYHKGGHPNGVFLQITGASEAALDVPGRPYDLGTLQLAQAIGDGSVLAARGRPVLRLHLADRVAGLAHLVKAIQEEGA